MLRRCARYLTLASPVILGGCGLFGPPEKDLGFDSPDPSAKLYAIDRAYRTGDRGKIPDLIEALDHDDPAVRLLAAYTLERLTGTRRGYDHAAPRPQRERAIEQWRAWWAQQPQATPAGASSPPHAGS